MKHSIRCGTGVLCLALLSAACLSCGENAETPADTTPSVTPAETEAWTALMCIRSGACFCAKSCSDTARISFD